MNHFVLIEKRNRETILSLREKYRCYFNDDFKIVFNNRGVYLKDHKDFTLINLLDDEAIEKTQKYIRDYFNSEDAI